jgi:hypothetical protein
MSRVGVTIDGVWIGNGIYWTLQQTARDYTLRITITYTYTYTYTHTVFSALLGSGFQRWKFHCSRVQVLSG